MQEIDFQVSADHPGHDGGFTLEIRYPQRIVKVQISGVPLVFPLSNETIFRQELTALGKALQNLAEQAPLNLSALTADRTTFAKSATRG